MTKKVKTPKFLNVSEYARRIGVTRQTVDNMLARGQIKIAKRKGRLRLLNVAEADKARELNRLRKLNAPTLVIARTGQIGSELALKRERLARTKDGLTYAGAADVGVRALADVLLPRIVVNDALVDRVLAAGDAGRVRTVIAAWVRDLLTSAAVGLKAVAAEYAIEDAPAPAQVTVGDDAGAPVTLAGLRAATADVETETKQLRLAKIRGELVDRAESLAQAEEQGRKVRARLEQLAGLSVELADASRAGRKAVQARLGAALGLIAADLRAMLDPASGKGAAA